MMGKTYYHITDPKNIDNILWEGLRANEDGEIFLFEDKGIINRLTNQIISVADHIALNQVGLSEYAMFAVDADGVEGELEPDNVGEASARCQWIARQSIIQPDYIEFCDIYTAEGWHDRPNNK